MGLDDEDVSPVKQPLTQSILHQSPPQVPSQGLSPPPMAWQPPSPPPSQYPHPAPPQCHPLLPQQMQYPPQHPRPPMHGPPYGLYPPPPPPPAMSSLPPSFKFMTSRDLQFVMQQQMKQIRSSDPFSDDYYYHNYHQKRMRGPSESNSNIMGRALPLPSWKLEHVQAVSVQDATRAAKSREWESEHQVLGRNNQRSLYRPKQSLMLSKDEEKTSEDEQKEQMVIKTQQEVFTSDLWRQREEIDRGFQCLLSLQDARHLLDARGINVQQFHSTAVETMDTALRELRTRTTSLLLELAALLGVRSKEEEGKGETQMECNVSQLVRMLSVTKGKRLVSRAMPLLHPSARFMLLPYLVECVLSAPQGQASTHDEEDERLCQTIVLLLLYHPPAPSAELLTQCLQRAMQGHDQASLRVLLYNRGRAEALQALLQRGGSMTNVMDARIQQEWNQQQERFVVLATAIKQAS